mmetsp:Transcript_5384/g.17830  ORF Transcript_5384/g.17830 Transcript_5384/m.17830 type:complete len:214 (-) Transcript_5384:26-667(-)
MSAYARRGVSKWSLYSVTNDQRERKLPSRWPCLERIASTSSAAAAERDGASPQSVSSRAAGPSPAARGESSVATPAPRSLASAASPSSDVASGTTKRTRRVASLRPIRAHSARSRAAQPSKAWHMAAADSPRMLHRRSGEAASWLLRWMLVAPDSWTRRRTALPRGPMMGGASELGTWKTRAIRQRIGPAPRRKPCRYDGNAAAAPPVGQPRK